MGVINGTQWKLLNRIEKFDEFEGLFREAIEEETTKCFDTETCRLIDLYAECGLSAVKRGEIITQVEVMLSKVPCRCIDFGDEDSIAKDGFKLGNTLSRSELREWLIEENIRLAKELKDSDDKYMLWNTYTVDTASRKILNSMTLLEKRICYLYCGFGEEKKNLFEIARLDEFKDKATHVAIVLATISERFGYRDKTWKEFVEEIELQRKKKEEQKVKENNDDQIKENHMSKEQISREQILKRQTLKEQMEEE